MKVFLLSIKKSRHKEVPIYDSNSRLIIRAVTSKQARRLANIQARDEGEIWEDSKWTLCQDTSKIHNTRAQILCVACNNG